jgi:menaquinone-dependent protoporphyrinogen oxidase
MRILVAYASKHGSTREIAETIAERLGELGAEVRATPAAEVSGVGAFDAVVLGSALYAGSWMKEAVEFVHGNAALLADRPAWLFSSGPLGDDVQDDEEQPRQLAELRSLIGPREHVVFFGAMDRTRLGFGERMMVKAVKAPDGDFRDWEAIKAWADRIGGQLGVGEPATPAAG